MLVYSLDNPQPKVGQILYKEDKTDDGKFEYASLVFIDEEIQEGKEWMYTQIACMEDYGNGMQVYTGIEAGNMPAKYTRLATDEDIKKFITMIKEGLITEGSPSFEEWLQSMKNDEILLKEEKERIEKLSL